MCESLHSFHMNWADVELEAVPPCHVEQLAKLVLAELMTQIPLDSISINYDINLSELPGAKRKIKGTWNKPGCKCFLESVKFDVARQIFWIYSMKPSLEEERVDLHLGGYFA